jgi:hypothetical protein
MDKDGSINKIFLTQVLISAQILILAKIKLINNL